VFNLIFDIRTQLSELICGRIFFNANKDLDTSPPASAYCIYDGKQIQLAQRIYIAIHYEHWHWRAGTACLSHTHFELVIDVGKVVADKVGVGCIRGLVG
jgi:hypothetical protein